MVEGWGDTLVLIRPSIAAEAASDFSNLGPLFAVLREFILTSLSGEEY